MPPACHRTDATDEWRTFTISERGIHSKAAGRGSLSAMRAWRTRCATAARMFGTALDEIAELARDVHNALAGRIFRLLGPPARPAQVLHDAIAATAYAGSRLGARAVPAAVGTLAAHSGRSSVDAYADTPRGHFTLSALNGFWGDRLADQRAALAPVMSVRTHAGTPAADARQRRARRERRRPASWWSSCTACARATGSGGSAASGPGATPTSPTARCCATSAGGRRCTSHYNTGLHISENGRLLAGYLETLVDRWPVPVTEIALVGHSMGGLVVRAAAHMRHERGLSWVRALRHVVGLGTPHLGAPLERLVNRGTHLMARLPETRPFATWLNRRSVGIKDLRHGAVRRGGLDRLRPRRPARQRHRGDAVARRGLLDGLRDAVARARTGCSRTTCSSSTSARTAPAGRVRPGASSSTSTACCTWAGAPFPPAQRPRGLRALRSWLDGADGADEGMSAAEAL